MATSAQCQSERALGLNAVEGLDMIDRTEQCRRARIVGTTLDPDRSLRRGGEHLLDRDRRPDIAPTEPVEPGGGKQGRIDLTGVAFRQPRVDIAADRQHLKVGAQPKQLRGAARAAAADPRAVGQLRNRPRPDQPVANIRALEHRDDPQGVGALALDILHRMDRGVGLPREQGEVELLGPQCLAPDLGERTILNAITAGADDAQRDAPRGPVMRLLERGGGHPRLRQRQRRPAGAQCEGEIGHSA